jgi:hypothetical protein
MNDETNGRRKALRVGAYGAMAGLGAGLLSSGAQAAKSTAKIEPMRFTDPIWNRETSARLEGDIAPGKQVFGSSHGTVCAVQPGKKVLPILRFEVFSRIRVLKQPDGSYQRLCRELVFYRDVKTNQILDRFDNPLTGENVAVVDVANDPFNWKISEYYPEPPSYGGLNAADRPPRKPFLLNWTMENDDIVGLESDIHLQYPSALKPDKWPRESPGPMTVASEFFRYFIRKADLENPAMTHVPYTGVWNRITPWLPWMLMDQAPGQIFYAGMIGSKQRLDQYPADTLARVRERYPLYLEAPTEWKEPSLSSLENYAREQQPAPPKAPKP